MSRTPPDVVTDRGFEEVSSRAVARDGRTSRCARRRGSSRWSDRRVSCAGPCGRRLDLPRDLQLSTQDFGQRADCRSISCRTISMLSLSRSINVRPRPTQCIAELTCSTVHPVRRARGGRHSRTCARTVGLLEHVIVGARRSRCSHRRSDSRSHRAGWPIVTSSVVIWATDHGLSVSGSLRARVTSAAQSTHSAASASAALRATSSTVAMTTGHSSCSMVPSPMVAR